MKNKKRNSVKLGLLLVMMIVLVSSVFGASPLTLYGENAQCDVFPRDTIHFQNGGLIYLQDSGVLYNLYKVNSAGGWDFIQEYREHININKPNSHYVVEVYGNCDFSLVDGNPFDNGKPDWFESCDDGYYDDGNGNCLPNEQTRLDNIKEQCLAEGRYFYDDGCYDEPNPLAQGSQFFRDLNQSLTNTFISPFFWMSFLIIGYLIAKAKFGIRLTRWF